jgi:hypothetical protein
MPDALNFASFEAHVGSAFRVQVEEDDYDFTLAEATDLTPPGVEGEQFSLLFEGPMDPAVPQGILRLEHEALGTLDLFVVPIGLTGDGCIRYEAFFNRLRLPGM